MDDIAGVGTVQLIKQAVIQIVFVINIVRVSEAQVYSPIFKVVDMQATIAPLGQMVAGNFYGSHTAIAAISKSEKALYLFEPDSMENLILTNVVSLPDTPVAIAKGKSEWIPASLSASGEVSIDSSGREKIPSKIAVLMKPNFAALVSFGKDGRPIVSREVPVDTNCTDVAASDLEDSGNVDIVGFGKFSLGISEVENDSTGEFQEARVMQSMLGSVPFSDLVFTDFNGDLVPDIAALDWVNRKLMIFYGKGDGSFAQPVSFRLRAEPSTLLVADLFGNGYPDIVVGYTRLEQIDIYGGDGFGRFYMRQTLKTIGPISEFAAADFAGNGTTGIAAFSGERKEITMFSYDSLAKSFHYAGAIGVGENYEDIIPFYFPNRTRADLVASSPTERSIKVFKTEVLFSRSPDVMVPVSADPVSIAVCGGDSSNYVTVENSCGRMVAIHYFGHSPLDSSIAADWQSEGTPAKTNSASVLIPNDSPDLLLSYSNADMLSLYEISDSGRGPMARTVMTQFLPFVVNAAVEDDSAIIATAYRNRTDSTVGISFFNSLKEEFIETDYEVNEKTDYLTSALAIYPYPSFFRVWKNGKDTLIFAYTNLENGKTTLVPMQGSECQLVSRASSPSLLLEYHDTLGYFETVLVNPKLLELHQTFTTAVDDSDFKGATITQADSTIYLAFFDHNKSEIFLSAADANDGFVRLIKSWHVEGAPDAVAISPKTNRIFFLNRSEDHVTISSF